MRRFGRKKRLIGEINVVPYIDVMLVLLIIFMVTAPLLSQGVKVDLPKAAAEPIENDRQEPFVVTVDAGGNYYLNDPKKTVAAGEIARQARAILRRNPDVPFLVRGDGSVEYAHVVRAMVLLQSAGVKSIGLVTESPRESSGS